VAIFEGARHWLVYGDIALHWAGSHTFYYERGGVVRAEASAGHALALGLLLAIAFGFWLSLQTYLASRRSRLAVTVLLWLGLLATYSRGPWAGAVVIYLAFMAIGPGAFGRIFKAAAVVGGVLAIVSVSPLGDRVFNVLPVVGRATNDTTLSYRQQLAARSWQLILEHPFFGDQFAYSRMEDLRQGEGIIDLVNTYAQIALFYGFVGLFFFVGFILLGLVQAYQAVRQALASDPELARLGRSVVACILGALLMILDSSFILGYAKMFYVLAGLSAAYVHLRPAAEPALARTV
jgi:O-antigen ligase